MKIAQNFLVFFAIICIIQADINEEWANFKLKYNKSYDSREDALRKEIYRLTLKAIKEHNAEFAANKAIYSMRVYHTGDLTDDELRRNRGIQVSEKPDNKWILYKTNFNKSYDEKEDLLRHGIFRKKMAFIKKHNRKYAAGKVSWSMGTNQFTDMTAEELINYM